MVLEPDNRHLLLDALRPPAGYKLDAAVGTTFSLDLEALLLAPVAFALFDARVSETGDPTRSDPIAVMEAVRRHADKIDLFCQTGQIALPPKDRPILALLEDSVHPAAAPTPGHIFHPKVWCLRFAQQQTGNLVYRLLVLSRNLTFDRSFDTIVAIDGEVGTTSRALTEMNNPLVDFIGSLPELATRELPAERTDRILGLADQILDVEWELPRRARSLTFLPSGIAGFEAATPSRADRALLISPFLTPAQLTNTVESAGPTTLISRPESLDHIDGELLDRFHEIFVLNPATDDPNDGDITEEVGLREETAERPRVNLTGIHAKALISDQGWNAEFRTGSTNATTAGWTGNVEFDVAIDGPKSIYGVEAVFGADAKNSLFSMLVPYRRTDKDAFPESEVDLVSYQLEKVGREIAGVRFLVRVEADDDHFRMILTSDRPLPRTDGVAIRSWPISRHPDTAAPLEGGRPVHLRQGGMSLQSLTSFFAFELSADTDEGLVSTRIVINARMEGAPEDRTEMLLLEQLKNKSDVLRYLLFLLADVGEGSASELTNILIGRAGDGNGEWAPQIPLYEAMVRALARHPEALHPINRLIEDLRRTEDGRRLLPDGIEDIWPVIWEAREHLK